MSRGRAVLAAPVGTFRVAGLNVEQVLRNPLGAIRANTGPDLIEYTAQYSPEGSFDAVPDPADRAIPAAYRPLFAKVAGELGLSGLPPPEAVRRVERYFRDNFRYSLVLRRAGSRAFAKPLADFLERSRTGHCEYFATSTVLLLRAAGIPARYAVGYGVNEYSRLERSYLVRRRHAHSWALVYLEGRWRNVDTTPAIWAPMEAGSAPWWEEGYDLLSWLRYRYDAWRWGEADDESAFNVLFVIVPLVLLLVWRLYSGRRVVRARREEAAGPEAAEVPGRDSEFYRIETYLEGRGLERSRGETLNRWIGRLRAAGRLPGADLLADSILPLHYRIRFDPDGIDDGERSRLGRLVRGWMGQFAGATDGAGDNL